MKLCVLVTTMFQKDFSKYKSMNLQCDAVIANQCDKNEIAEEIIDGHRVKMVSTDSRGVSRNRNIALEHCYEDCDYILFSDDDLLFAEGYTEAIEKEFQKHPEAEGIKFNLMFHADEERRTMGAIKRWEKATRRNMSASGVWGLVIKKDCVKRTNLWFDECFGPGTANYCGEDTIYIQQMLNKKMKLYRSPVEIASVDQTESSWYEGCTPRYYETAGMVFYRIYPHMARLLAIRSAWRHSRSDNSGLSFPKMLACYQNGIRRIKRGDY